MLEPAIKLAETGYAVSEIAAAEWQHGNLTDMAKCLGVSHGRDSAGLKIIH